MNTEVNSVDTPLISIIIRTKDRPHLLIDALQSVSAQTYPAIEVVVVNDGGDDIEPLVTEQQQQCPYQIVLVNHDQSQGRSAAANTGLLTATGEWAAFLDDDDVFLPEGIATLAQYIKWDKPVIYGQVNLMAMHIEGDKNQGEWQQTYASSFDPHRLYLENYIPICAYICRKDSALTLGGFDTQFDIYEDWEFLLRLAQRHSFHYVESVVSEYRIWGDSFAMSRDAEKEYYFRRQLFRKHLSHFSPDVLCKASSGLAQGLQQKNEIEKQQLHADFQVDLSENEATHKKIAETFKTAHDERFNTLQTETQALLKEAETRHREDVSLLTKGYEYKLHEATVLADKNISQIQQLEKTNEEARQQVQQLDARLSHEHAVWHEQVQAMFNKSCNALPFNCADKVALDQYAMIPDLKVISGEETQAHTPLQSFSNIASVVVLFEKPVAWQLDWTVNKPAHLLSLRFATYNRVNECQVQLEVYHYEDATLGECCARATLAANTLKDNQFHTLVLDNPLEKGQYFCVVRSDDANVDNAVGIYVCPHNEVSITMTADNQSKQVPRLNLPIPEEYQTWYEYHHVSEHTLLAQTRALKTWAHQPLISLVIPTYNSIPEWLDVLLKSVNKQSYTQWECIIVDDASPKKDHLSIINFWCNKDARFTYLQQEENQGVGYSSQAGVKAAKGEYIAIIDHDDSLEAHALFTLAEAINTHQADVFYSDEVLLDEEGKVLRCAFRPDYNYDFLLSHPYIIHLTAFKREILEQVGGFNTELTVSQDYDLLLRVAEKTDKFHHIPHILYRWRTHERSTGHSEINKVTENSLTALNQHLQAIGFDKSQAWAEEGLVFNFFRVRYVIAPTTVSIIIPTRDRVDLLENCIDSLYQHTKIPQNVKLELIVVDNNSSCEKTLAYFEELKKKGHKVLEMPVPFNYSLLNNEAVKESTGDMLLFLNNDIEILKEDAGWLEAMLEPMARPEVGIVGAKLLYPDIGLIQHAGVLIGYNGAAGHDHQFFAERDSKDNIDPGHNHALCVVRECMAVTAACMLVRREAFDAVGGYDLNLEVGFGDTDLCLRIVKKQYKCLFTPYARLIHHESATRGYQQDDPHPVDSALFRQRWLKVIEQGDVYYNPNLTMMGRMFEPRL